VFGFGFWSGEAGDDDGDQRVASPGIKVGKKKMEIEKMEIEKMEIEKMEIEKMEIEKMEIEKMEIEKMDGGQRGCHA
jgi:hypothetical protein